MSSHPSNLIAVKRPRVIHPAAAPRVAAVYRGAAYKASALATQLGKTNANLDAKWAGRSKDAYNMEYDHIEPDLRTASEVLNAYATEIANMTVTIWETVYVTRQGYVID